MASYLRSVSPRSSVALRHSDENPMEEMVCNICDKIVLAIDTYNCENGFARCGRRYCLPCWDQFIRSYSQQRPHRMRFRGCPCVREYVEGLKCNTYYPDNNE